MHTSFNLYYSSVCDNFQVPHCNFELQTIALDSLTSQEDLSEWSCCKLITQNSMSKWPGWLQHGPVLQEIHPPLKKSPVKTAETVLCCTITTQGLAFCVWIFKLDNCKWHKRAEGLTTGPCFKMTPRVNPDHYFSIHSTCQKLMYGCSRLCRFVFIHSGFYKLVSGCYIYEIGAK